MIDRNLMGPMEVIREVFNESEDLTNSTTKTRGNFRKSVEGIILLLTPQNKSESKRGKLKN